MSPPARAAGRRRGAPRRGVLAAACALLWAGGAAAQDLAVEAVPGSDGERYLRALQVAGGAPLHPWSVRGFSPAETERLLSDTTAHPWQARVRPELRGARLIRPRLDVTYNSAFPYGDDDGAVWTGKGVTASGSLGVAARWGALSLRLEPMAFWAQNARFELAPTGRPGDGAYADPINPTSIDLPQRFGDDAYMRVDPGQSTVRLDAAGFALGVSTAAQAWGPGIDQPLMLSAGAPGFLHGFAGTSSPWKVGIGRVHGRLVWGDLRASEFSPMVGDSTGRLMAGMTGVFLPWGLDGLEIGFSRFFHIPYAGSPELEHFARPLDALFKAAVRLTGEGPDNRSDGENQLASVTVRWVLPRAGVEVYGEYLRDDHNWDLLDFFLVPDHTMSYLLGGARAWRAGRSLYWVRAEWVNSQASHLAAVRNQGHLYRHGVTRQGHTHRGQLLGSAAGYGGGGSVVAFEAFTPRGRWSVDWTRTRVADNWGLDAAQEPVDDAATDVVHSLGGEVLFFRGPVDVLTRVRTSWELNRHFSGDAFNLTASLGVRVGL